MSAKIEGRAETDEAKRALTEQVLAVWQRMPGLRLGQLIVNAIHDYDLFNIEDEALLAGLLEFERESLAENEEAIASLDAVACARLLARLVTMPRTVSRKAMFHRGAVKVARALAERMGLKKSEFEIRSVKAGTGVYGEVVFETERVSAFLNGDQGYNGVLYRKRLGRRDSGPNLWWSWDELTDLDKFASVLKAMSEGAS